MHRGQSTFEPYLGQKPSGGLFDPAPESFPYVRTSPTSRLAASQVRNADIDRERIRQFVAERGERGATREEAEEGTGIKGSTLRPRVCELIAARLLVETTVRRKTRSGREAAVLRSYGG